MTVAPYVASEALVTAQSSHDHQAKQARELAARYVDAVGVRATLTDRLSALELFGWRVLTDRRWLHSGRSRIDAVLVGPGGVVVLDAHAWAAVTQREGTVFDGDDCKEADASAVRAITDKVHDALTEFGVTRQALWSVVVLAGRHHEATSQQVHLVGEHNLAAWVASRPARLEDSEIQALVAVLDRELPAAEPADEPANLLVGRWPASAAPLDVQKLTTALFRTATARPVERWMTFLDEAQLALITTSWDGPARLTGPAGTGKTVVGLHRAAYLAERNSEPVLYVAATAAMPGIAATLIDRLTPQARDNVVSVCLRDLAVAIVQQGSVHVNLDDRQSAIAFVSAWMASGRGGALSQLDERPGYWQEEIDHVVKARGITELDDYLALERDPRRIPLDEGQRTAVWRVLVEYKRRLTKSKVHDLNDVLILARDLVRGGVVRPSYSAVVVDNVEDLPLVALELVHLLAGDGPDRLLLIDDGQQASYAGADTLAAAGITLSAPASQLADDHRSSGDVLRLATRMIGTDTHLDVEGLQSAHVSATPVRRRGAVPTVVDATDLGELERALVVRLTEITDSDTWQGEAAVLVATATDVDHLRTVLMRAALPVVDIAGVALAGDRIVLGTFAEAKGLSFDHVLMPGLRATPKRLAGEHDAAFLERSERLRRLQYVGITRARHGLWLGYLRDADDVPVDVPVDVAADVPVMPVDVAADVAGDPDAIDRAGTDSTD